MSNSIEDSREARRKARYRGKPERARFHRTTESEVFEIKTPGSDLEIKTPGSDPELKTNGSDLELKTSGSDLELKTSGSDLVHQMHGISLADPSEPKDKHNELSAAAPESPARERSCSPGACPGADDSHEHVPEEQHISSPERETKRVLEPEAMHTVEPEPAQGPAARQRKRPSAQRRQPRERIVTAERAVQDMPERMTRSMARKVGVQQPRRFFGEGVSASQILRPTGTKP